MIRAVLLVALRLGSPKVDEQVAMLEKAIAGRGTDEAALAAVLESNAPEDVAAIEVRYNEKHAPGTSLRSEIYAALTREGTRRAIDALQEKHKAADERRPYENVPLDAEVRRHAGPPIPKGTALPRIPGFAPARTVTREASSKAHEIRAHRPDLPIGSAIEFEMDGKTYVARIEWHKHPPEAKVSPALKEWHRGVTLYEEK